MYKFTALLSVLLTANVFAAGDAAKGEVQFGQCTACHTVVEGGAELIGPNLFGVSGSIAASRSKTFDYSPALKKSAIAWTDEKLDQWIKSPGTLVPGAKMEFTGISRAETRANIIAYLKSLKK
jgi:cytochrome c